MTLMSRHVSLCSHSRHIVLAPLVAFDNLLIVLRLMVAQRVTAKRTTQDSLFVIRKNIVDAVMY